MRSTHESQEERALKQRSVKLLSMAGGAVLAVVLVALSTPGAHDAPSERLLLDTAPATDPPAPMRVAALDAGVDWDRVERAPDVSPLSVAAYER
jgi:hypothetical protein